MLARCLAQISAKSTRAINASVMRSSFASISNTAHYSLHNHDRRLDIARINALLFSLDRFVSVHKQSRSATAVANYIRNKLDQPIFHNLFRHIAYDRIILLLLQHRRFGAACKTYDTMCGEGILPSPKVRTRMLGISVVCTAKNDNDLLTGLKPVFSPEIYDEYALRELLDLLALHYSPDLIDKIFKLYIASRGHGYIPSSRLTSDMIDIQIRGGLIGSARELLNFHTDKSEKDAPYPYVTMLKALRSTPNPDAAAIDAVLQRMKQDTVVPDIALFNALISTEVWRKCYHQAFTLYHVVKSAPEELKLRPDVFTFASLFKAVEAVKDGSRKWRQIGSTVSPRELYREMLTHHLIETQRTPSRRSSVITPSVLSVALRTFMAVHDYPAAFLVLRTFVTHNFQPLLSTYLVVLKSLAIEIRREMKKGNNLSINHRSMTNLITGVDSAKDSPYGPGTDADIFQKLLTVGRERSLVRDHPLEQGKSLPHSRSYRMPTMGMLMKQEMITPDITFHIVPLQRILRKVIAIDLGCFGCSHPSVNVGGENLEGRRSRTPAQMVSRVIVETKRDMIPEMSADPDTSQRKPTDRRKAWSKSKKFVQSRKLTGSRCKYNIRPSDFDFDVVPSCRNDYFP